MEIQKTTGVVLFSRLTSEADYLIRMFTKEYGKRDFIFKGLKKSRRRSLTISEPGTIGGLVYYFHEDRRSYIVNEFQVLKHYINIRNTLQKIFVLYFLLEIVEKTTGFNDPNRSIFDLLVAGIDILSKTEYSEYLSFFFTIHLLRDQGILPSFKQCKICNRYDYDEFSIDSVDFHPICRGCSAKTENNMVLLGNRIREYIHQSLMMKFVKIDHPSFPLKEILNLLSSLTLFIESYYYIEIKSKELLISEISKK